jgi:hypothetical protein
MLFLFLACCYSLAAICVMNGKKIYRADRMYGRRIPLSVLCSHVVADNRTVVADAPTRSTLSQAKNIVADEDQQVLDLLKKLTAKSSNHVKT